MHRKIVGNQVNNENRSSNSGCCRPCPGKIFNSFTNTKLKLPRQLSAHWNQLRRQRSRSSETSAIQLICLPGLLFSLAQAKSRVQATLSPQASTLTSSAPVVRPATCIFERRSHNHLSIFVFQVFADKSRTNSLNASSAELRPSHTSSHGQSEFRK